MEFIEGGVTAAKGFSASGIHCGIRKNKTKPDLALILSDRECAAAGVYTRNLVKGAPITVTKRNIADGRARAIICNSGIANTCAPDGIEKAEAMCRVVSSSGVWNVRMSASAAVSSSVWSRRIWSWHPLGSSAPLCP